jgi:hypothetical protein
MGSPGDVVGTHQCFVVFGVLFICIAIQDFTDVGIDI